MDEYLTLNQGVDEFESLPEHMENIEQDAQKLFEKYSFLVLKTCKHGMKDLSEYEQKVIDRAIDLHREDLHKKLNAPLA